MMTWAESENVVSGGDAFTTDLRDLAQREADRLTAAMEQALQRELLMLDQRLAPWVALFVGPLLHDGEALDRHFTVLEGATQRQVFEQGRELLAQPMYRRCINPQAQVFWVRRRGHDAIPGGRA
jgi:hypothetical protein